MGLQLKYRDRDNLINIHIPKLNYPPMCKLIRQRGFVKMILKTNKAFKPKTFARKAGFKALQIFINDLPVENFEDNFAQRYESCPSELKEHFHLINDVACDKARPELIKYTKEFDIQHQELNTFELVCFVFQKNKQLIFDIFSWLNIDSIDNFREFDGSHQKEANHKNISSFNAELAKFFSEQGKGNQVEIDIYNKQNKTAYIINHGNYIKNEYIANDEKMSFEIISQRKANSITLVYLPKLARLRIKCKDFKTINFIRDKFAEHMLEDKTFFDNYENKQYFDLEKLVSMTKDDFVTNPEFEIKDVDFTRIEGNLYEDETLKSCLASRSGLLNKLGDEFENRIANLIPMRIHLQFKFESGKGQSRTIQFAEPNISNLNESTKDLIIEKCLKQWEII